MMTSPSSSPSSETPDGGTARWPGRHSGLLAVVAVLALTAVVVWLVLVTRSGGPGGGPSASAPTSPTATTQIPTASTSTRSQSSPTTTEGTSTQPSATSARPSAYAQLGPFFVAAARMDQQLHTAAARINEAGPPWYVLGEDVARSVRAADIENVSATIPGGMPRSLLRSVMLVESELASRRAAMAHFDVAHGYESPPAGAESRFTTEALLSQLRYGFEAASRFDGDLAAARSLASSSASFARAPLGSRADMEVLLLTEYVRKGNFGCDGTGGFILRDLPRIVWNDASSGTIGGLPFVIRLEPSGKYTEDPIEVC